MEDGNLFIDPHVHVLPKKRLRGLMRWIKRAYPAHPVAEDIGEREIIEDLRARGVTHFFNLVYPLAELETESLNLWNIEFCRRTPGAIPFASLHPETPDKPKVAARAMEAGFVGMKFHPFVQGFDPWDRRMEPLYSFMEEAGRPVIIHTGFEDFYQLKMPARSLQELIERHPRLPLVLVHMAFPELAWAFAMLDEHPRLYLDATNVLACIRPEFLSMLDSVAGGRKLPEILARGIEEHRGRVMFGSDYPAGMGSLKQIYADLDLLETSKEAKRALVAEAPAGFIERPQRFFNPPYS